MQAESSEADFTLLTDFHIDTRASGVHPPHVASLSLKAPSTATSPMQLPLIMLMGCAQMPSILSIIDLVVEVAAEV